MPFERILLGYLITICTTGDSICEVSAPGGDNMDQLKMDSEPSSLCEFLEWITTRQAEMRADTSSGFSISLHMTSCHETTEAVCAELIRHLNCFDPVSDCHWRAFKTETLRQFAERDGWPSLAGLLGSRSEKDPEPAKAFSRLICLMTTLPSTILVNAPVALTRRCRKTFRVGILGNRRGTDSKSLHLTVNPSHFPRSILSRVIADAALEWAYPDSREPHNILPMPR